MVARSVFWLRIKLLSEFVDHNMTIVNTYCLPRCAYWCIIGISSIRRIKLIYQVYEKPPHSLPLSLSLWQGIQEPSVVRDNNCIEKTGRLPRIEERQEMHYRLEEDGIPESVQL